jgi:hypothetical protein
MPNPLGACPLRKLICSIRCHTHGGQPRNGIVSNYNASTAVAWFVDGKVVDGRRMRCGILYPFVRALGNYSIKLVELGDYLRAAWQWLQIRIRLLVRFG